MHRISIIVASGACLAFTDCNGEKADLAAYYCASYTRNVCDVIASICTTDDPEWLATDTAHEWYDQCLIDVSNDCEDYYLAAEDTEAMETIITSVCASGYAPGRQFNPADYSCEDMTSGSPDFEVSYPYEDTCPCLVSLEYHQVAGSSTTDCGP